LNLKCEELQSYFAFNFKLRRYNLEVVSWLHNHGCAWNNMASITMPWSMWVSSREYMREQDLTTFLLHAAADGRAVYRMNLFESRVERWRLEIKIT
jgi:hypothetical protein